jgi:hypothetical protein
MRTSAVETLAIGSGLGALGLAAGSICGMTVTGGAAQALLTGLFTFVGGTILSYSAFAAQRVSKKTEAAPPPPNVVRIGAGLAALSMGLVVGAVLGLWFRYHDPLQLAEGIPPGSAASEPKGGAASAPTGGAAAKGIGLQDGPEDDQTLARVRDRLRRGFYTTPEVLADITGLNAIAEQCLAHK